MDVITELNNFYMVGETDAIRKSRVGGNFSEENKLNIFTFINELTKDDLEKLEEHFAKFKKV